MGNNMYIICAQLTIGRRTINISHRKTWVKWVVIGSFIIATILEWFTDVYQRIRECERIYTPNPTLSNCYCAGLAVLGATVSYFVAYTFIKLILLQGNCTPGNNAAHLSVWLYYAISMFYDIITLTISTIFLMKADTKNLRLSLLLKM